MQTFPSWRRWCNFNKCSERFFYYRHERLSNVKPSAHVDARRSGATYESLDGIEIRFLHGEHVTKQQLSLNLTTSQKRKACKSPFKTNGTTYGTFNLPAEVFAGQGSYGYTNESNVLAICRPANCDLRKARLSIDSIQLLGVAA